MNGIVILNKPCGLSSNTACRKVGKLLGEKKVGHLGTLDPMAEGVLPITLGKCTKLFDYYLKKEKTYIAEFTFGYETDTLDIEGQIIANGGKIPTSEEILQVLPQLCGNIAQVPPKYSAKKINGKRAYDLARENINFELKAKNVTIYKLELLEQVRNNVYKFLIECSAGTYIRSIARDLACKLRTYAIMSKLTRTKCGEFTIENSHTFDSINENIVITPNKLLGDNVINIDEIIYKEVYNTGYINLLSNGENQLFLVKFNDVDFGIATQFDGKYKLIIRFI